MRLNSKTRNAVVLMRLQSFPIGIISPILLILVVNLIAFLNLECCIIVFLVLPVILSSYYIYCAKKCERWAGEKLRKLKNNRTFFLEQTFSWFSRSLRGFICWLYSSSLLSRCWSCCRKKTSCSLRWFSCRVYVSTKWVEQEILRFL